MSNNKTGGPAFPLHSEIRPTMDKEWCGMTLRDYFAAKAMQGMLTRPGSIDVNQDAAFAYMMADAMLKVREQ